MRTVMTLVVRDEAELIRDHLDYHLAAGVAFVIATDHRSADGTREILEDYERRGSLRLITEDGEHIRQAEWQTRMSRLAALEHDADWVLVSDADEFWFGRDAPLAETLIALPDQVAVVRASMLNFVPVRDGAGSFAERMLYRLSPTAAINDAATPYRPVVKVAHRGDPTAVVSPGGGHGVSTARGSVLRGWHPLDLLHFPLRSREQCERKYRKTWTGWASNLRGDIARARRSAGVTDAVWDRVALTRRDVERGVAEGTLVVDARLRDALRSARRGEPASLSRLPGVAARQGGCEAAVFADAELVRTARRLDELGARARALELGGRRASPRRPAVGAR